MIQRSTPQFHGLLRNRFTLYELGVACFRQRRSELDSSSLIGNGLRCVFLFSSRVLRWNLTGKSLTISPQFLDQESRAHIHLCLAFSESPQSDWSEDHQRQPTAPGGTASVKWQSRQFGELSFCAWHRRIVSPSIVYTIKNDVITPDVTGWFRYQTVIASSAILQTFNYLHRPC